MKFIFTSLSVLYSLITFSQDSDNLFPVVNGKVIYEQVDSSVNGNSAEIYNRAKLWVANTFRNSKNVIQIDDKESGTIVGKGNFDVVQTMTSYIVRFTFKIDARDSKYRIQFYDISSQQDTKMGREQTLEALNKKSGFGNVKEKINTRFKKLLTEVRMAMRKQSDSF